MKTDTDVKIVGASACAIGATSSGWSAVLALQENGGVRITLRTLAPDEPQGNAVWLTKALTDTATWRIARAGRTGWHRLCATRSTRRGHAMVVATWETDSLTLPVQRTEENHERWIWMDSTTERKRYPHLCNARDLARYFILGWTRDSPLAHELREHRGDPYPEMSALALEQEWTLAQLAKTPWELAGEQWDDLEDIGKRYAELLAGDGR